MRRIIDDGNCKPPLSAAHAQDGTFSVLLRVPGELSGEVAPHLPDHLVGCSKPVIGELDPKRPGGLQFERQFELGRVPRRQVAGAGALQNAIALVLNEKDRATARSALADTPPAERTFRAPAAASSASGPARHLRPAIHLPAVAAVPLSTRWLRLAFRTIGRAVETDMEVPVMPQPWLHLASHVRSSPASRQSAFLMAVFTNMRLTRGSSAAALISATCAGVHTFGSISLRFLATIIVAIISSRSSR